MRQQGLQHFSDLNLNLQRGRKMRPAQNFARDGFNNGWVGMPKGQRTKGHHPIDVFSAIHIIKPRPLTMRHITGRAAKGRRPA